MEKLTKKEYNALLEIAKKASYSVECRGDLKERMCDDEDFIECSVWSIETMLIKAYELGKKSK